VISFSDTKDFQSIQVSPGLGYRVKENFSIGLGPTLLLSRQNEKWNVSLGYRAFAKYEIFHQRAYLQTEYLQDPGQVNSEYFRQSKHSILAGAGYLLPLSKKLAINICLLYRVNNTAYSQGVQSPWVFRLGLSTIKPDAKQK
jgi:hypothetical protein